MRSGHRRCGPFSVRTPAGVREGHAGKHERLLQGHQQRDRGVAERKLQRPAHIGGASQGSGCSAVVARPPCREQASCAHRRRGKPCSEQDPRSPRPRRQRARR
eukprot:2995367-Prymnesium_polylepis.1